MSTSVVQNFVDQDFILADEALEALHATTVYGHEDQSASEIFSNLKTIYSNGDESTRYKILSEIIDIGYKDALPFLTQCLKEDQSGLVRHEAAFGIGLMGSSAHCPLLIEVLLNDVNPMVRHEAAISLAGVGREEELVALFEAIEDTSSEVQASALFAIKNIQMKLS